MWWIRYRFSWLDKNKKATINPINEYDYNCFQCCKLAFNYSSKKNDWKCEKKSAIALNVLYATKEDISCIRFKT